MSSSVTAGESHRPRRLPPLQNPATQLLAKMLGLPAPEGEATSFLGGAAA